MVKSLVMEVISKRLKGYLEEGETVQISKKARANFGTYTVSWIVDLRYNLKDARERKCSVPPKRVFIKFSSRGFKSRVMGIVLNATREPKFYDIIGPGLDAIGVRIPTMLLL